MAEGVFSAGWLDLELSDLEDNFAIVFGGRIETARAGECSFELGSGDNSRLSIDGKWIADAHASMKSDTADVQLTAGSHALRVEYLEFSGLAGLQA